MAAAGVAPFAMNRPRASRGELAGATDLATTDAAGVAATVAAGLAALDFGVADGAAVACAAVVVVGGVVTVAADAVAGCDVTTGFAA